MESRKARVLEVGGTAMAASHLKRAKISQDNRFLSFSLPLTDFHQFRLEPPLSLSLRVDSGSKRRLIHLLSFRFEIEKRYCGKRAISSVISIVISRRSRASVDSSNFFHDNIREVFFSFLSFFLNSKRDGEKISNERCAPRVTNKRSFVEAFRE